MGGGGVGVRFEVLAAVSKLRSFGIRHRVFEQLGAKLHDVTSQKNVVLIN